MPIYRHRWSDKIAPGHFSNSTCLPSIHAKSQLSITICRFHHLNNPTIKPVSINEYTVNNSFVFAEEIVEQDFNVNIGNLDVDFSVPNILW